MIHQQELKVKVGETDAAVTGFAGLSAVVRVAHQTGLVRDLDRLVRVKRRRRGYSPGASALDLMLLLSAGGECIEDLEVLRSDRGLSRLLRRRVMAPSTGHDFLRKIGEEQLEGLSEARRGLIAQVAAARGEKRATLDFDASLFASGVRTAQMSYTGERGWMPMLCFWAELDLVVQDEFRHGNVSPGANALSFLIKSVSQLPDDVDDIRIRSDSAWYIAEILDHCEDNGYKFSITADKDGAVQQLIREVGERQWVEVSLPPEPLDSEPYVREWAYETVHTLNKSRYPYRLIVLRRERRQPDLFEGAYTYGAIITNMQMPLAAQLRWHRERCNCENHIKELKNGLSMRVLPSGDFSVNAAYLRIGTLAYNLLSALKHLRLAESWRYLTVKTIRFRLLAMPALVVRHARELWLRAPRGHPHLAVLRAALA